MKFVKVTALAAAMAASFGAQAELAAMDDSALEAVTGQKGITVALDGSIVVNYAYNDKDGATAQLTGDLATYDAGAGSLLVKNITIESGLEVGVDVNSDQQLVVSLSGLALSDIEVGLQAGDTADFTATMASIGQVEVVADTMTATVLIDAQ